MERNQFYLIVFIPFWKLEKYKKSRKKEGDGRDEKTPEHKNTQTSQKFDFIYDAVAKVENLKLSR